MTASTLRRPATARDRLPLPAATVLTILAAALLALLTAPTALAHDTLLESDPADGASLETSPDEITLTFSAEPQAISPVVRIDDADDEAVAEIEPRIEGNQAIAELPEPLPAGDYTVHWRVVSSDGHPIEDTFEISVAADPETDADATAAGDGAAGAEDEPDDAAEAPDAAADDDGSLLPLLLAVAGVAVLGVVIAAVVARRRRS